MIGGINYVVDNFRNRFSIQMPTKEEAIKTASRRRELRAEIDDGRHLQIRLAELNRVRYWKSIGQRSLFQDMPSSTDTSIAELSRPLFLACMHAETEPPPVDDYLEEVLLQFADIVAVGLSDQAGINFEPRPDAAGYLVARQGKTVYNLPYYLAYVWPTPDVLASLNDRLPSVRLGTSSSFCLSGSSTFLGKVQSISDIDCCEYFTGSESEFFEGLKARAVTALEEPCVLAVYKVNGGTNVTRPFNLEAKGDFQGFANDIPLTDFATLDSLKLDFVADIAPFGPLAVTNMVLPVSGPDDLRMARSFQFQEAVAQLDDAAPLRGLVKPGDLGRYLRFLRQDALCYLDRAKAAGDQRKRFRLVVKALKRMTSWLLIIDPEGDWRAITNLLNSEHTRSHARAARAAEAASILGTIQGDEVDRTVRDMLVQAANGADGSPVIEDASVAEMMSLAETTWMVIEDLSNVGEGGSRDEA